MENIKITLMNKNEQKRTKTNKNEQKRAKTNKNEQKNEQKIKIFLYTIIINSLKKQKNANSNEL